MVLGWTLGRKEECIVLGWIGKLLEFWQYFDKTQGKLFPNFTSIPFDCLLISWVTNYAYNRDRFHLVYTRRQTSRSSTLSNCSGRTVSGFFWRPFSSHQFSKTLTQLIVGFRVFRFSATSFNAVTSILFLMDRTRLFHMNIWYSTTRGKYASALHSYREKCLRWKNNR